MWRHEGFDIAEGAHNLNRAYWSDVDKAPCCRIGAPARSSFSKCRISLHFFLAPFTPGTGVVVLGEDLHCPSGVCLPSTTFSLLMGTACHLPPALHKCQQGSLQAENLQGSAKMDCISDHLTDAVWSGWQLLCICQPWLWNEVLHFPKPLSFPLPGSKSTLIHQLLLKECFCYLNSRHQYPDNTVLLAMTVWKVLTLPWAPLESILCGC